MIAVRCIATGEVQYVASLAGIDMAVWQVTGDAVPQDLEQRAYLDGTPVIAPLTALEFISLWTPAETRTVMQTDNDMMALAWATTLVSPTIRLDDPRCIAGVGLAQQLGILTADRAAAILAGQAPA